MRLFNFSGRNIKEMLRDPILYVMCVGFPVFMYALFAIINSNLETPQAIFQVKSLLPGLMMFSGSFVMLMLSLLVSKDRQSAFLVRLYSSPMKAVDFVGGYVTTGFVIGIIQQIVCVITAAVVSKITGEDFINPAVIPALIATQIPMLLIDIFLGILLGTVLNEKAAPGLCSVFISASGVLGGAWMPLDTMGSFEKICTFLPFYPTVYWGRILTEASHMKPSETDGLFHNYSFDAIARQGVIVVAVFLVIVVFFSIISFARKRKV